jgi:hypothetical protein
MPESLEWLVEYRDDGEPMFEHIASRDDAIDYVRQLVGQGRVAVLYQRVPFEVKVNVTVKAPRTRRKTPAPPLTGPGNGEAVEPKGAASPHAEERQRAVEQAPLRPGVEAASPVRAFDCEARLENNPECPHCGGVRSGNARMVLRAALVGHRGARAQGAPPQARDEESARREGRLMSRTATSPQQLALGRPELGRCYCGSPAVVYWVPRRDSGAALPRCRAHALEMGDGVRRISRQSYMPGHP